MSTSEETEASFNAIDKLLEEGDFIEVLVLTSRLLELDPPSPIAAAFHRRRARAYTSLENWEEAAMEWAKALACIPEEIEAAEEKQQGRCGDDKSCLKSASSGSLYGSYQTLDNHFWAMRDYNCCVKNKNRRNVQCEIGKENPVCVRAEEQCTSAIRSNPDDPTAYCARAGVYQCRRNWEAALADCCRAIELDPRCVVAYSLRASIHNSKGDLDEAIADWTRVIELNPSDAISHTLRGLAYEEIGEEGNAEFDRVRASELDRQGKR